jgi:hypothetical protein
MKQLPQPPRIDRERRRNVTVPEHRDWFDLQG